MGVYADLLANAVSIDAGGDDGVRAAGNKALVRQIRGLMAVMDPAYPSGFEARDEVQVVAQFGGTPSAGTFNLAFSLWSGESFTTDEIAYDADAATIETAIDDAAALAGIVGFVAGDIAVTGGPLDADDLTLTYSGDSVAAQNHGEVAISVTGLTGGTAGDESTTTDGQADRTAWATLRVSGCISSDPPAQGVTPTSVTAVARANNPHMPDQDVIRALAREASIQDQNADVYTAIVNAFPWA